MSVNLKIKSNLSELQTRKPSLLINASSNYVVLCVNIAIGLLLTPFIIRYLGKTGYGIWTFVISFIGYYGLLNLGVNSAITRYVALYKGRGNEEALYKIASTAMAMFWCTGILAISLSFFLAAPLAIFFEISPDNFNDFRYVVWVMGLAMGLSFPSEVFSVIMTAHERYVPANSVKIASAITRAGLIVYLLLLDTGLIGVAFATLGSQLLGLAANYLMVKLIMPQVQIRFTHVRWAALQELLFFGGTTMVIVIADHLRMNVDSFVIGKYVGMAEVGVYAIAAIIIRYIVSLVGSGMGVLMPRFAALQGSGDFERIKGLFIISLRISAFLAFGSCMGAIIFGKHFIFLWVGKDFSESTTILWILTVPFALALSQNPGIGIMYALKKHRFYAIATMFEAIANISLSILLVSKYGIIGVALGTAIPMTIVKTIIQPIYVSRIVDISVMDYAKAIIPYPIISSAIILLAYNLGIISYDSVTFPFFIYACIATSFIYIFISFLLLNKNDKDLLRGHFSTKISH